MWEFLYAFILGMFSILSPCTFVLVPLIATKKERVDTFFFLSGVLCVYLTLGFLAVLTGKLLTSFMGSSLYIVAAIVTTIAGLDMLGLIQIPRPRLYFGKHSNFVSGLLYGGVSLSCVGPLLAAAMALTITVPVGTGLLLMGLFSLGFVTPFIILGLVFTSSSVHGMVGQNTRFLRIVGGLMLLAVALYLLYFGLRGLI